MNSSDKHLSKSDVSSDDADEANQLWGSTKRDTKFFQISYKEQGQDEAQNVDLLSIPNSSKLNEEMKTNKAGQSMVKGKKPQIPLQKTRKAKSSADNQPVLISSGFLALGSKNNVTSCKMNPIYPKNKLWVGSDVLESSVALNGKPLSNKNFKSPYKFSSFIFYFLKHAKFDQIVSIL